mgnify:CR=1 FL=1
MSKTTKEMPYSMRFLFAGCAGIGATLCVHPLDVVRISLQLDAEGGGECAWIRCDAVTRWTSFCDPVVFGNHRC